MDKIKVAIDLHRVYDSDPSEFEKLFVKFGKRVQFYIFSGAPVSELREYTHERIKYNIENYNSCTLPILANLDYLSIVDFCFHQNFPMDQRINHRTEKLTWYYSGDEEIWWAMKSVICKIQGIHLLVDDKLRYSPYFGSDHVTRFWHFDPMVEGSVNKIDTIIEDCLQDLSCATANAF